MVRSLQSRPDARCRRADPAAVPVHELEVSGCYGISTLSKRSAILHHNLLLEHGEWPRWIISVMR